MAENENTSIGWGKDQNWTPKMYIEFGAAILTALWAAGLGVGGALFFIRIGFDLASKLLGV